MTRFEYDNIEADKLILEFKCKECHSLTKTELLKVPELDFDTLRNMSYSYKHKCQCGACYNIEIINGLYDNYGVIDNEEEIYVHEVPDIPYNNESIFLDTIESFFRIESIVKGIEDMGKDDKNYVYCLLFTNLITILDSFIKIYTEPLILSDDGLIDKFSITFGMPAGDREEKIKKIMSFYKKRSFQSITSQMNLFKDVFHVEIEIDDRIKKYVAIRDIIIHRNAIDMESYIHRIKESQLLQALGVIKAYVSHIHSVLLHYRIDKIVEIL